MKLTPSDAGAEGRGRSASCTRTCAGQLLMSKDAHGKRRVEKGSARCGAW